MSGEIPALTLADLTTATNLAIRLRAVVETLKATWKRDAEIMIVVRSPSGGELATLTISIQDARNFLDAKKDDVLARLKGMGVEPAEHEVRV